MMNGLMAIPNLIGLIILSGLVARETRAYLKFDPKLRATSAEIERALADEPGYQAWRTREAELDRQGGIRPQRPDTHKIDAVGILPEDADESQGPRR